ncbi:MAG: hypothetical protein INR71_16410, partial [Terriglobus roseus]|nr:hypothetical protein [Terriglobus roseus]
MIEGWAVASAVSAAFAWIVIYDAKRLARRWRRKNEKVGDAISRHNVILEQIIRCHGLREDDKDDIRKLSVLAVDKPTAETMLAFFLTGRDVEATPHVDTPSQAQFVRTEEGRELYIRGFF